MGQRTGERAVRRWGAVVAWATLVVALAAAAPPALAHKPRPKPKPRPDLSITRLTIRFKGGLYAFQNERDPNISIEDRTTNVGTGKAGRSLTKVYLEHAGKRWLLAQREVPPLGPDQDDAGSDVMVHVMDFPLGAYTVVFCADADHRYREGGRKGQCRTDSQGEFYVAAARWTGTVNGEYDSILGNVEKWSSPDAEFLFDRYEGDGIFSYGFLGTVTWTDSGTDEDGCAWSGSGSHTFTSTDQPVGSFSVDYRHLEFNGAFAIAQQVYQSDIACPNSADSTANAPQSPGIFSSGIGGPRPLPFGATTLPGSPASGELSTTFSWSLAPAAP